jgi:peptidoglycan/LPS O-acetylase OafA/YrhL
MHPSIRLACLLAAIVFSMAVYRLLEVPARQLIRDLLGKTESSAAVSAHPLADRNHDRH